MFSLLAHSHDSHAGIVHTHATMATKRCVCVGIEYKIRHDDDGKIMRV